MRVQAKAQETLPRVARVWVREETFNGFVSERAHRAIDPRRRNPRTPRG